MSCDNNILAPFCTKLAGEAFWIYFLAILISKRTQNMSLNLIVGPEEDYVEGVYLFTDAEAI